MEAVQRRVDEAREIDTRVRAAARINPAIDAGRLAHDFITASAGVEHVSQTLAAMLANQQSPEIAAAHHAGRGAGGGAAGASGDHGWGVVAERHNGAAPKGRPGA